VARVVAFIPDLLFGSRVVAMLEGDGHEVKLAGDATAVREALVGGVDALIFDLTDESLGSIELIGPLRDGGLVDGVRTLAFYSHVDADMRLRAEEAGFDLVVPRSRMAREGATLVGRLVAPP
jgi:hypothetical protein